MRARMINRFTGNQTGPRQLELPPNIAVFDSAGMYCTLYSVAEGFSPVGGRDPGGIEEILNAERYTVQRATILPGGDLLIGFPGLHEPEFPLTA
jgi:hypothetical protein